MVITRDAAAKAVKENGVQFQSHSEGWTNWLGWCAEKLGWVGWRGRFWMTIGHTIYHPDSVKDPLAHAATVIHECAHAKQQRETVLVWWLFRYCTSWRYRWEQEREAYLVDLLSGETPLSFVVGALRTSYGIKLSAKEMGIWFQQHLYLGDAP
jgi:hypothetical protein